MLPVSAVAGNRQRRCRSSTPLSQPSRHRRHVIRHRCDRRRSRRRGVDGDVVRGRGRALVAGRIGCLGGERMAALASAVVVIEYAPPVATPVPSTVVPSVSYSVTVLPASAVPVIVSVASFEKPLSATVPVTGSTSSVTV